MTLQDVRYRDRAVYLSESDTLVFADVHLGRGRAEAVTAPLDAAVDLVGRVRRLCEDVDPTRVVIAGDLLDSFDRIPPGVAERTRAILDAIVAAAAEPVVLAGNHDGLLSTVYDGRVRDEYVIDGTVICHGHERPDAIGDRYVIGHEHPALRVEGVKRPCYLVGEAVVEGAVLVVLPAFSPLLRGTAMNRQRASDCHAPLLQSASLRACQPVIRDENADETLTFPSLDRMTAFL